MDICEIVFGCQPEELAPKIAEALVDKWLYYEERAGWDWDRERERAQRRGMRLTLRGAFRVAGVSVSPRGDVKLDLIDPIRRGFSISEQMLSPAGVRELMGCGKCEGAVITPLGITEYEMRVWSDDDFENAYWLRVAGC